MAIDSLLLIPFILFILLNSFRPSAPFSKPHYHTSRFAKVFDRMKRIPEAAVACVDWEFSPQ